MSDVQLWRYTLPSIKGSGWAIFVLGSDGYFSSVSDFGRYAFMWGAHGCKDFREFLFGAEKDPDYFIGKLSPGEEYDGVATKKAILDRLLEMKKNGDLDRKAYVAEVNALKDYDIENYSGEGFREWVGHSDTKIRDSYELSCTRHPRNVERFVKEAMVRLIPLLKADLASV